MVEIHKAFEPRNGPRVGALLGRIAGRIGLVFLALIFGLALAEGVLRVLKPELRLVASSKLLENAYRIHTNPRNLRDLATQPDVRERHVLIFNALGLRQHRDFAVTKPAGTYRIGFFGDSFTANLRLPVQYSFSEPLDYLLNRAGRRVEVLNFGTDGYGTDQSYLQYVDESPGLGLDMVVYLMCHNDLRDNLADHLYKLDATDHLTYIPRAKTTLGARVIRRLYLTYFAMTVFKDQGARIAAKLRETYDESTLTTHRREIQDRQLMSHMTVLQDTVVSQEAVRLFLALMKKWKAAVEQDGRSFRVALVPNSEDINAKLKDILDQNGFDTVDLFPTFKDGPGGTSNLFFKTDYHWNGNGNTVATVALYRYLAPLLSITDQSDEFIRRGLSEYYSAFKQTTAMSSWQEPVDLPDAKRDEIKAKYLKLETTLTERKSFRDYGLSGGNL